ncbi:hypothetical protein LCGC14_1288280 [marine sediment metagenome]|uniref:Uncharacterized protein n=1 Tax=marine sediment metagenome TaxID=412755 RepID=A0A0F9LE79_9ZZZZ
MPVRPAVLYNGIIRVYSDCSTLRRGLPEPTKPKEPQGKAQEPSEFESAAEVPASSLIIE